MCPGISLGGGRLGIGLAKMSLSGLGKKSADKKRRRPPCCGEIFWRCLLGSGTPSLKELWKLGSKAALCHPHENSVELGADTHLLGRSPRSPHNILAAKPWRVAASPTELQARSLLWSFLSGTFAGQWLLWSGDRGGNAAHVAPWRQNKVCRVRETVGSCSGCMTCGVAMPCGA